MEWGIKDLQPEKCFQVNPLGNEDPATAAPFSRSLTQNDRIEMSNYTARNYISDLKVMYLFSNILKLFHTSSFGDHKLNKFLIWPSVAAKDQKLIIVALSITYFTKYKKG